MQIGDILFVRGKSPISKVIKLVDKGEFSHVSIAVSETHILEAQYFTKSRITPIYFDDYEIIRLDLTERERIDVLKLAINLVGKWYDYIQILGYVLKHRINNPNSLICSELVANLLYSLGKVSDSNELRNATPNELYYLLKERFLDEYKY